MGGGVGYVCVGGGGWGEGAGGLGASAGQREIVPSDRGLTNRERPCLQNSTLEGG